MKKGVMKSSRLEKFEKNLQIIEKTKNYLERELSTIRNKQEKLRKKISTEKQAIYLSNRAKRLRSSKK